MDRLPKFAEEKQLAETLKTPQAVLAYEKLQIGAQIKKSRAKNRVKQHSLAQKLKTSQSVIARIEAGKQNLTLETLVNLSLALGKKLYIRFL